MASAANTYGDGPGKSDSVTLWQRFSVPYAYPVMFVQDMLSPHDSALASVLRTAGPKVRTFVVIDDGVARAWPTLQRDLEHWATAHAEHVLWTAPPMVIPGGEQSKNDPAVLDQLLSTFQRLHLDRHACVVAIGGGAMLDVVGYAAAITHRGLRLIRVPTTVLGQNDAGVGVKNGVNAFGTKNFLGSFSPPYAVINDARFLTTLSDRDRHSGIAEAIKVALIRDIAFFEWLEAHATALYRFEHAIETQMIQTCAGLHLDHIAQAGDPFEHGSARPLDFGHWAAHKLETLSGHRLRHGEAVAIGMLLDARYSTVVGLLDPAALDRIAMLLGRVGLPRFDETLDACDSAGESAVLRGLEEFREHLGGELTVTLLAALGQGIEVHTIDHGVMNDCISWLATYRPERP